MVDVNPADLAEAVEDGFRQDTAEKVFRLLGILREIQARPEIRDNFTLKGGTALNIFHLPSIPRLSVDIDLVATGYPEASPGDQSRAQAIDAILEVAKDLDYHTSVDDSETSGCTIHCTYTNTLGNQDKIKVDLDFLNRKLLMLTQKLKGPAMFYADDVEFPMVAVPELVAQKLVAVCYRAHARDLYDMTLMLGDGWHKDPATRQMYLAYSFLVDHEWYRLDYLTKLEEGKFDYHPKKLHDVVRANVDPPTLDEVRALAQAELGVEFTRPSDNEREYQARLMDGDSEAFADLLQETDPDRREYLETSPALAFRLSRISKA